MPKTRRRSARRSRKVGGKLLIKEGYLPNTHLCGGWSLFWRRAARIPGSESIRKEVYTATDVPYALNETTLPKFLADFKHSANRWFKFVIFNNSEQLYIYVINGNEINKHSVPLLFGLMELVGYAEYPELWTAFKTVEYIKRVKWARMTETSEIEANKYVIDLNTAIEKYIPCMPAVTSGSGTVLENGTICLNPKSGHYMPKMAHMEIAKAVFEGVTKQVVTLREQAPKSAVKAKFGARAEDFTGFCL